MNVLGLISDLKFGRPISRLLLSRWLKINDQYRRQTLSDWWTELKYLSLISVSAEGFYKSSISYDILHILGTQQAANQCLPRYQVNIWLLNVDCSVLILSVCWLPHIPVNYKPVLHQKIIKLKNLKQLS